MQVVIGIVSAFAGREHLAQVGNHDLRQDES
jgi:hypothetical protein